MSSTCPPVALSRLPVGSSAKITLGSPTRALAIATRCFCPPERSVAPIAGLVAQVELLEGREAAPAHLRASDAGDLQRHGHVVEHAAVRREEELLEDEAEALVAQPLPLARAKRLRVHPVDLDGTGRRCVEEREQLHERGLARAALADHGERLAPVDLERDGRAGPRTGSSQRRRSSARRVRRGSASAWRPPGCRPGAIPDTSTDGIQSSSGGGLRHPATGVTGTTPAGVVPVVPASRLRPGRRAPRRRELEAERLLQFRELRRDAGARDRRRDTRLLAQPGQRDGGHAHAAVGGDPVDRLEKGDAAVVVEVAARAAGSHRVDRLTPAGTCR